MAEDKPAAGVPLSAIYLRVLGELGPQRRLAAFIALANIAVAAAAFAVPILFGWIIDALTRAGTTADVGWYMAGWALAALFNIAASVWIAFRSDHLAHGRRLAVMSEYFEHVLTLPQAFHTQRHSGSLLKIMFDGCNTMSDLWLSFFRENFTSFVVLFVMLPFSLLLNWQLGRS